MPTSRPEGGLLAVRVQPRARDSAVAGWRGAAVRVRVTAAPEAGEANRAVADVLARALGVAPSAVQLVRGAGSRDKLFRVAGLPLREVHRRLGGGPA
jgi:hypothetical protein